MTDGNTMIGSVMTGHGLDQDMEYDEQYLVAEDQALEQEEEKLMNRDEVTSEEDETMERHMLTTALVNSVVETSHKKPFERSSDESGQRYSLRKRRRPTGKGGEKHDTAQVPQKQVAQHASDHYSGATHKTSNQATRSAPPTATPDPAAGVASDHNHPPASQTKSEGVPAVTVPAPSSLAASMPPTSSLPLALQPPQRQNAPPRPLNGSATGSARASASRAKAATKPKQRLAPAARIPAPKVPLAPDVAVCGVPNPLSNPFPVSSAATTAANTATNAQTSNQSFRAGTKLTVPCPLPHSTFESNVRQTKPQVASVTQTTSAPPPAPEPEKKKTVTISNEVPAQTRGRIFSIDLDPASLDFSVLDPDPESGVPAPASADLPLLSGGPRDRAYSFECFAFGINADEPLSGYGDQSGDNNNHRHPGARMRGDSIIFDPTSFQEGGIHEEHALTTRESRGMSIDLDSIVSSMPAPPPAAPIPPPQMQAYDASSRNDAYANNVTCEVPSSAPAPSNASRQELLQPKQLAPVLRPDYEHSYGHHSAGSSSRLGNHPSNGYQDQRHAPVGVSGSTPSYNPGQVPSTITTTSPNGTVAVVGSASQTFQMELLNKDGRIGIYLPEARKERIARFHAKRKMRIWRKRIKYDCRKKLADSRPRIKGRFVKRSDMDD